MGSPIKMKKLDRIYQISRRGKDVFELSKSKYELYIFVVYSTNSDSYSKTVDDSEVRKRGSFKWKTPYHHIGSKMLQF